MIDPIIYILACLLSILVSSVLPLAHKPMVVTLLGLLFLSALAPASAVFLLLLIVLALVLCMILDRFDRKSNLRKYAPYLLLISIFWVDFEQILVGRVVDTAGVSFAIIRIFITCKQLLSHRSSIRDEYLKWLFVSAFYLPVLMVGPIFSAMDFRKQVVAAKEFEGSTSKLYRRLFQGVVLIVFLTPVAFELNDVIASSQFSKSFLGGGISNVVVTPVFLFLQLFFAFWGQSLIAENTSRIIGLDVPSNFNKPWNARNIRDFWQRWHISMANFVTQYIYLPLTLKGVNGKVATVLSFTFMGLWHEVAIGYIIWGFCHGLLLAYWPKLETSPKSVLIAQKVILFSTVIGLSYVANYLFKI